LDSVHLSHPAPADRGEREEKGGRGEKIGERNLGFPWCYVGVSYVLPVLLLLTVNL